ncbi:hypothetical protein AV926_11885 [Myroides marinus]|uniref:Uncharacterized protein n=2 Tax=Myroides marinus TaxID=703342 RepID=A0A163YJ85_9FLAO|nr:hypothetical protein AV926_11885 [Myroides marinus]
MGLLFVISPFVWTTYFTYYLIKHIVKKDQNDFERNDKIGGAILGIIIGIGYIVIFIYYMF